MRRTDARVQIGDKPIKNVGDIFLRGYESTYTLVSELCLLTCELRVYVKTQAKRFSKQPVQKFNEQKYLLSALRGLWIVARGNLFEECWCVFGIIFCVYLRIHEIFCVLITLGKMCK